MDFDGFAAAMSGLADRAESGLALVIAEEAAKDFLAVLRVVTPKRSGHLAASETVDAVIGSGATAVAVIGAHAVYAEFREHGGTISVKNKRVLSDGVSFFGKSVTQRGSHYFEKADAMARPDIEAACRLVLARFLTL